jgi:ABC-type cobalamin/Fe3+-siderophores transport system ATPase subunit
VDVEITLQNYRVFGDDPAKFRIADGFTCFVGPNNSGKSSILRLFHDMREVFRRISTATGNFNNVLNGGTDEMQWAPTVMDPSEVFSHQSRGDLIVGIKILGLTEGDAGRDRGGVIHGLRIVVRRGSPQMWTASLLDVDEKPLPLMRGGVTLQREGSVTSVTSGQARIGSIDSLFSTMSALARACYVPAFRNIINVGGEGRYFDIQTGELFVRQWSALKSAYSKPGQTAAYQITRLIERIFEYKGLEINASHDQKTLHLVSAGRSYRLDEVGAGVSQFVITLINAAIRRPSMVLIDEPETGLHPMLQRDFLNTLAGFAESGVVFSTHSIGLARSVADRVYTVSKDDRGCGNLREYSATPRLAEFLGELSHATYRELGFDCILLVEGPSDVRVFQELLRHYQKDQKVVILQLGGSDTINGKADQQLSEIRRITDHLYAVVDSDRTAADSPPAKPVADFLDACVRSGIRCHILTRRSIENYFPSRAVAEVFGPEVSVPHHYAAVDRGWRKELNWKIASLTSREDLAGTDLEQFLRGVCDS